MSLHSSRSICPERVSSPVTSVPASPENGDVEFDEWVATLPKTHWARYDLAACRLGWNAQLEKSSSPSPLVSVEDTKALEKKEAHP